MSALQHTMKLARSATTSDLRKFGIIFACVLATVFYFLLPWLFSGTRPLLVLQIAGALLLLALFIPVVLRPLYLAAMAFAGVMGAINNRIILSLIFFLVFTPMAIVMRFFMKNDPMRTRFDSGAETYRILRENKDLVKNKEKAF